MPPKSYGTTPHVDLAAQVKAFTRLPVCAVGSIIAQGLEMVDAIIGAGEADLCALGRAQHADPYFVKKCAEGRETEITKCIHCNKCTFWTTGDPEVYCTVNPDYKKPKE